MSEARQPTSGTQARRSTGEPTQGLSTQFLFYETEGGRPPLECRAVDDSQWLSQVLMAELFPTYKQNINVHVKKLLVEGRANAVRMLGKRTTDEDGLIELNKITEGFPKKKGGSDAT
jgi:hypothetical protein